MKSFTSCPGAGALLAPAMLLLCALTAPSANAQKTYRCGSTYQSFPCAGAVGAPASAGAATKGATVAAKPAAAAPATAPANAPMTDAEKKAAAAKAAAAEKMVSELNYIIAQQKSGGSQTTMDRIAAERKQSEADLKKEGCSA